MSWAEVKKINSDMDVPLDELIKHYIRNTTWYAGIGSELTVLNFTTTTRLSYNSYNYNNVAVLTSFVAPADGMYSCYIAGTGTSSEVGYNVIRVYFGRLDGTNAIASITSKAGSPTTLSDTVDVPLYLRRGEKIIIKAESGSTATTTLTSLRITCNKVMLV